MSELTPISDVSALPTTSENDGASHPLPSSEPQMSVHMARREARSVELEAEAAANPSWAAKYAKPRKRRKPKPPKESRVRKACLGCIALRAQGLSLAEAAEYLGLTPNTMRSYLQQGRASGWITLDSFNDPTDKLEIALKSTVVQNIATVLEECLTDDEGNPLLDTQKRRIPTDRAVDMTKEVAKGTGLLKAHQVVKAEGGAPVNVALKVDVQMPSASGPVQEVRPGAIGGVPAYSDAEVVDA